VHFPTEVSQACAYQEASPLLLADPLYPALLLTESSISDEAAPARRPQVGPSGLLLYSIETIGALTLDGAVLAFTPWKSA